ncbi:HEPN domain-containing protein [Methanobrevibacter olleyae]|uniref:HEPN domain-containing protein n=1 Tax=Methanobrevibacter olleyae TaxID=294671 RepID=A0A1I4JXE7_METOL|nr:HEPN domain-containing protein [Methanobrevibacter olleyae]SFL71210.1 HEPN domain-containing protein [Methanobrevibacter olleyae]
MNEIESCIEIAMDDLESSKLLLEAGKYRNSITLSYYAMFSIARALLLKKGLTPKTHDGVITLLGEKYVLEEGFDRDLASRFSRARTLREDASYGNYDDFDLDTAKENIWLVEEFIDEAKKFL